MITKILPILSLVFIAADAIADIRSTETNPARTYQSLKASYDASSQELELQATFRNGGMLKTTIDMVAGESMTATTGGQTREMGRIHRMFVESTLYRHTQSGPLEGRQLITWKARNAKTYVNDVTICAAEPVAVDRIEKSKGLKLAWTGPALAKGEKISVSINGASGPGHTELAFEGPIAAGKPLVIPALKLKDLAPGAVRLHFLRSRGGSLKNATPKGGSYFSSYSSRTIETFLVP